MSVRIDPGRHYSIEEINKLTGIEDAKLIEDVKSGVLEGNFDTDWDTYFVKGLDIIFYEKKQSCNNEPLSLLRGVLGEALQ